MKHLSLIFALLFLAIWLSAQGWQTTLPISIALTAPRLLPTSDGGYFTAGVLKSAGETDLFAAKLNAIGSVLWLTQLQKPGDQVLVNLFPTADGFSLVGSDTGQVFFQPIDENGQLGTSEQTNISSFDGQTLAVANNGDVLFAVTASFGTYAERRTHDGTPIWWRMIDNGVWGATIYHNDACLFINETASGDILTGGHKLFGTVSPTGQISNTYTTAHLTLLNAQGDILYRRFFENSEDVTGAWEMPDGHMAALTRSLNPYLTSGFFRVKYLDVFGMLVWEKYFDGKYRATKILPQSDGSFTVVGYEEMDKGFGLQNFIFLKKLDTAGNEIWHRTLPFPVKSFDQGAVSDTNGYTLSAITDEAEPRLTVVHLDADAQLFSGIAQGKLFHDFNGNCTVDTTDEALSGWVIDFYKNGQLDTIKIASDGTGNYLAQLDTGTYNIKVKTPDQFWTSCQTTLTINGLGDTLALDLLVRDTCPTLQINPIVYTLCGEDHAEINLQVAGGFGPDYQFQWSNGSTDSLLTGLSSGTYFVTVQDGNCFHTDSVVVAINRSMVMQWQQAWGGSSSDFSWQMSLTPDGGCLVTGSSSSNDGLVNANKGLDDAWLLRYDSVGNLLWQKGLGSSNYDEGNTCGMDGAGNAWLAGKVTAGDHDFTGWTTQGADVFLAKMDVQGNLQNLDVLQGSYFEAAGPMAMLNEGGLLIINSSSIDGDFAPSFGGSDAWAYRFDGAGNEVWKKNLVNPLQTSAAADEAINDVAVLADGGFLFCGYRDLGGAQNQDLWMLRTDANGNKIWEKSLGGSQDDGGKKCMVLPDGNFLWSGYASSNDGDVGPNNVYYATWLIKTTPAGDILWKKVAVQGGDLVKKQQGADDGIWVIAGDGSFPGHTVINSLDNDGNFVEQITLGSVRCFDIQALPNGQGYLFLGRSDQTYQYNILNQHGSYDFWVGKLGSPLPIIQALGADTIACPGAEVVLNAQAENCNNCSYLWDDGSTGAQRSYQVDSTQLTHVIVTMPDGCQGVDHQLITKNSIDIKLTIDGANCGTANGSILAKGLNANPNSNNIYQYHWETGSMSNQIANLSAGTYNLSVSDGECDISREVEVPLTEAFKAQAWSTSVGESAIYKQYFELPDGSIAAMVNVVAATSSLPVGNYLFKYDSIGHLLWQTTLDQKDVNFIPTIDGGFAIIGNPNDPLNYPDYRLKKLDALGETLWEKTYSSPGSQQISSVCQSPEGGYLLAGYSTQGGGYVPGNYSSPSNSDAWLLKTDAAGNMVWSKIYGGTSTDEVNTVLAVPEGYVLAGKTYSQNGTQSSDMSTGIWIFKINEEGQIIWNKTVAPTYIINYLPTKLLALRDGGFIYGKHRFDAGGNAVWEKDLGNDYMQLPNGEFISVSSWLSGGGGSSGYAYEEIGESHGYEEDGAIIWHSLVKGRLIRQLSDGNYLVAGRQYKSNSMIGVSYDFSYLQKYLAPTQLPQNHPPDTIIACLEAPYLIETGNPGLPYHWSNGSTAENFWVTALGNYSVTVGDSCGQTFDFVVMDAGLGCLQNISQDIMLCSGDAWEGQVFQHDTLVVDTVFEAGTTQVYTTIIEVLPESIVYIDTMIEPFDTFFVGSMAYVQSGEYTTLLTASNGCDSLVILHLNACSSNATSQVEIGLCQGDASPYNGTTYDTPGDFTELAIFPNIAGCDSIVAVAIIVHPLEEMQVDTALTYGSLYHGVLLTQDTQFVSYDTTEFGCLLTITENVTVSPSATSELGNVLGLWVFPNPTSGEFFVEMDLPEAAQLTIQALDPIGRNIKLIAENDQFPTGNHRLKVDASQWPSGVYLLHFQVNEVSIFKKIIKI